MNNEHRFRPFRCALGVLAMIMCARVASAQISKVTVGTPVLSRPIDPDSLPKHLAADSSGNVWFTYSTIFPHQIGFFSVDSGAVTTFPILQPDPTGLAAGTTLDDFQGLTIGPDKNAWFVFVYAKGDGSPLNSYVGRLSPSGAVATFPLPTNDACFNADCQITPGPDGNLWLTEQNNSRIARVTPQGVITEFATPTPAAYPSGITGGPDSNVWFTEYLGRKIGRITPTGTITEFSVPTPNAGPLGIATADGALWFTEYGGNKIGRITPTGTITEFPLPVANARPSYIVPAPDGNLYFTMFGTGQLGQVPTAGAPFAFAQTDIQPLYIVSARGASPSSGFSLFFSGIHGADYELRDAVSNCPPITITGPNGEDCVGQMFSSVVGTQAYTAAGGSGPYTYDLTPISGAPPAGLTFAGSPPSISGIARAPGSYTFVITATDANGCKGSAFFTLTIVDCKPVLVRTPPKPPTIAPR